MWQEKDDGVEVWKQRAAQLESQLVSVQQSYKARMPDGKGAMIDAFGEVMQQLKERLGQISQEQEAFTPEVWTLSRYVWWMVGSDVTDNGCMSQKHL